MRFLVMAAAVMLLAGAALAAVPVDLRSHERQVFSQFGEDGVLERIFEIIRPTSKYAVEFGAIDGIKNCNARNLIVNHGWGGLLIEGDPKRIGSLAQNYRDYKRVTTLLAWVYPGNVEVLFEDANVPRDLDLLVIDIDSNDYYVWKVIHNFRPKVVMIEANPEYPPPQRMVIAFDPNNYWDGSHYYGASAQSLYALAKSKGYELVYHVSGGNNLLFVDAPYYDRFGITDNAPSKIYTPVRIEQLGNPRPFLLVPARRIPKRILTNR